MGKKALLIGCNYPGTEFELKGCINDVTRVRNCLVSLFGFDEGDISVLIDTDASYTQPTGANVREAMARLVEAAEPGDFLFVHYSGHGTRLTLEEGEVDDTGYDECIVPCDFNLITDDDFRDFVVKVPDGCRLTIVSDSCHSGGLIDRSKEQIGESYNNKCNDVEEQHFKEEHDAFVSRDIELPLEGLHHSHRHRHQPEGDQADDDMIGDDVYGRQVKNRSLPISQLIEILEKRTGKKNINERNIRATLFDIYGDDASPKIKKVMKVLNKLQHGSRGNGGIFCVSVNMIARLLQEFLRQKPALLPYARIKQEVSGGAEEGCLPDNGILISGCQTDEKSADAKRAGRDSGAVGALSNAIQSILARTKGKVSNKELVLRAREMLARQGFSQRPGLYCNDNYVDAPFICC